MKKLDKWKGIGYTFFLSMHEHKMEHSHPHSNLCLHLVHLPTTRERATTSPILSIVLFWCIWCIGIYCTIVFFNMYHAWVALNVVNILIYIYEFLLLASLHLLYFHVYVLYLYEMSWYRCVHVCMRKWMKDTCFDFFICIDEMDMYVWI